VIAVTGLLLGGCDKPSPPSPTIVAQTTTPTAPAATNVQPAPPTAIAPTPVNEAAVVPPILPPAVDSDQSASLWISAKTATFDQRTSLFPVVEQLEARVDAQIAELNAKRATMTGTTQTNKWDFAMTEMNDARAYLRSMSDELRNATAENWDQLKNKVDHAWVRTQDAVSKVQASTTT